MESYRWLTISEAAKYFNKDVSVIRRWCYSGAAVTFGFLVRRDQTRHWEIGIPAETTRTTQSSEVSAI